MTGNLVLPLMSGVLGTCCVTVNINPFLVTSGFFFHVTVISGVPA